LAVAPARKRTRRGEEQRHRDAPATDDEKRARRATANRVWASLRASLNHAAREHRLSDEAWRHVKPFPQVSSARLRFLSDDEALRLVNASGPDLRNLVTAALMTGMRYGELGRLRVEDFRADAGTVQVVISKSGKSRHVALSQEGREFFSRLCQGKQSRDLMLTLDGREWRKAYQQRRFSEACKAARIEGASIHCLRHTYASRLIMRGASLSVVAAQLGHTSTAMVERHYGHLAPSHVSETVHRAFGQLGILEPSNVAAMKHSGMSRM